MLEAYYRLAARVDDWVNTHSYHLVVGSSRSHRDLGGVLMLLLNEGVILLLAIVTTSLIEPPLRRLPSEVIVAIIAFSATISVGAIFWFGIPIIQATYL